MAQIGRELAIQAAKNAGIDPDFFLRVIQQESRFNPNAVSPVGAEGYAQIMPATAKDPGYGIAPINASDPVDNLRGGAEYLAAMHKVGGGDPVRALVAYNWGPGNAQNWDGSMSSLPEETRNYVTKIMGDDSGPVTLADAALISPDKGQGQPSTLAEEPPLEKRPAQFHPGLALQSIGAALTASARGESANDDLAQIREMYFAEKDADYKKAKLEQQRRALIDMVGADSTYGRALLNGADPNDVLTTRGQELERQQQERLAQMGWAHDSRENELTRDFQGSENDEERAFRLEEGERSHGYRLDEAYVGHGYGKDLQNDRLEAERIAAEEERKAREKELGIRHGYDLDLQKDGQEFTRSENDLNRAGEQLRFDMGYGLDERKQSVLEATTAADIARQAEEQMVSEAQGAAYKSALKSRVPPEAQKLLDQIPDAALGDPAVMTQISSLMTSSPDELPAKIREFHAFMGMSPEEQEQYLRMQKAGSGGTNVTIEGDPVVQRMYAETAEKEYYAAEAKASVLPNIDRVIETLAANPKLPTGSLWSMFRDELNILRDAGMLPEGMSEDQTDRQLIDGTNFLLSTLLKQPGSVTEWEQKTQMQASAGTHMPMELLRDTLKLQKGIIERDVAKKQFVAEAISKGATAPAAREAWNKRLEEGDPMTKPRVRKIETDGDGGFTEENLRALGPMQAGEFVYLDGNPLKLDAATAAALNRDLGIIP